ncbi:MAG: hypothetical protein CBC48_07080, partial [bacterium TMED88]
MNLDYILSLPLYKMPRFGPPPIRKKFKLLDEGDQPLQVPCEGNAIADTSKVTVDEFNRFYYETTDPNAVPDVYQIWENKTDDRRLEIRAFNDNTRQLRVRYLGMDIRGKMSYDELFAKYFLVAYRLQKTPMSTNSGRANFYELKTKIDGKDIVFVLKQFQSNFEGNEMFQEEKNVFQMLKNNPCKVIDGHGTEHLVGGPYNQTRYPSIIMPKMDGDLHKLKDLRMDIISEVVMEVADILNCLWDSRFVYTDLKPGNVAYRCVGNNEFEIWLIDVGDILHLDPNGKVDDWVSTFPYYYEESKDIWERVHRKVMLYASSKYRTGEYVRLGDVVKFPNNSIFYRIIDLFPVGKTVQFTLERRDKTAVSMAIKNTLFQPDRVEFINHKPYVGRTYNGFLEITTKHLYLKLVKEMDWQSVLKRNPSLGWED